MIVSEPVVLSIWGCKYPKVYKSLTVQIFEALSRKKNTTQMYKKKCGLAMLYFVNISFRVQKFVTKSRKDDILLRCPWMEGAATLNAASLCLSIAGLIHMFSMWWYSWASSLTKSFFLISFYCVIVSETLFVDMSAKKRWVDSPFPVRKRRWKNIC